MTETTLTPPLDHRARTTKPELIVLHATAGASARSSISVLRGKGLSYHYIIARDGLDSAKTEKTDGSQPIVFSCAPAEAEAFHVGSTIRTPSGQRINRASVGISLANIQRKAKPEPYTELQLAVLDSLIESLRARFPSLTTLTTHAVVQPWNRSDPQRLDGPAIAARHGLTWWEPTADQVKAHKPKKP